MGQDISLFGNDLPESYKNLLSQLDADTNLTGGDYTGGRRISIRGAVFRKVINGEEVAKVDSRNLDVVIVKASTLSRTFYKDAYKEGETAPPLCWSADAKTPSPDVLASDKQAESCDKCPQNIKGSGTGESRACRYSQRLAVLLAEGIQSRELYTISIPATSIFGSEKEKMGMQAYARFLASHKAPTASIVSELKFDTDSTSPKLTFKPVRPLNEAELTIVAELQKDPETAKLVELKISPKEHDEEVPEALSFRDAGSEDEPKTEKPKKDKKAKAKTKKPEPEPEVDEDEDEEEEDEPKVKVSRKPKPVEEPDDLSALLDGWGGDDEDEDEDEDI